jgi:hypothetical protein
MIRNSMFLTAIVLILMLLALMKRLAFLVPAKLALFSHCGGSMAIFICALALNLFAAILAVNRKMLLKDTGRKLSHFDNQLQAEGHEGLPPFLTEGR